MPKGNFSIDYVLPHGVLNEGEGLMLEKFSLSEMCSLGQISEAGRRSRGRMQWRGGGRSVSAASTYARKDA